jgi:glycine/D-amino acid oxidase-like deaminating enzyme
MAETFDVLIIGAGIVGAACALELTRASLRVAVIERDTPGGGATAAGMGHLVVMDDSEAQLRLTRYSQTLWQTLMEEEPDHHEYQRSGTIWIAADDEEMRTVQQKHDLYQQNGVPGEILDSVELYRLEPHLRPGLAGGFLVPDDGVVYPPRSALRLLERAQCYGATLFYGTVVRLKGDGVQLANGEIVRAGAVVVANGSRASELLPEIPVRPRKGHLAITDRYPDFVHHQLIELGYVKNAHAGHGDSISFNVQPRATGQLLIGSSRQFEVQTGEIDYPILGKMLALALSYLPGLVHCSCIRVWTGFRAATPDGLPLIGPHPDRTGVWLAAGHEGLGITTSLATARLLSARFCARETAIPWEPYLPARVFQEASHE